MNYSNIKRNFLLTQYYEHILSGSHIKRYFFVIYELLSWSMNQVEIHI
jgi:hypothetical protein